MELKGGEWEEEGVLYEQGRGKTVNIAFHVYPFRSSIIINHILWFDIDIDNKIVTWYDRIIQEIYWSNKLNNIFNKNALKTFSFKLTILSSIYIEDSKNISFKIENERQLFYIKDKF